jgi:hypothetical protein
MFPSANRPRYLRGKKRLSEKLTDPTQQSLLILVLAFDEDPQFLNAQSNDGQMLDQTSCASVDALVQKGHHRSCVDDIGERLHQAFWQTRFHRTQERKQLHKFQLQPSMRSSRRQQVEERRGELHIVSGVLTRQLTQNRNHGGHRREIVIFQLLLQLGKRRSQSVRKFHKNVIKHHDCLLLHIRTRVRKQRDNVRSQISSQIRRCNARQGIQSDSSLVLIGRRYVFTSKRSDQKNKATQNNTFSKQICRHDQNVCVLIEGNGCSQITDALQAKPDSLR